MSIPQMNVTGTQSSVNNSSNKPLVLKEGQMVHGQVKKLFPGQLAEVQVGNQKMIAKLEVAMKAGDAYYFQVKSVQPELQLKIISGPAEASDGKGYQLNKLMEAMQLPKTSEMKVLLSFIIKNKIPMTREGLLQVEALLKNVPSAAMSDALTSIQKMSELKLPFTEPMFRSILGVESKEGLHSILTTFKGILLNDTSILPQAKESIQSTLDALSKPFAEATGSVLLGQSLVTLLNRSETADTRFAAVQLLKGAGLLPKQTSLANLPQVFVSLLTAKSTEAGRGAPSLAQGHQTMQEVLTHLKKLISASPTGVNTLLDGLKRSISAERGIRSENKEVLLSLINRAASAPSTEQITRFVQEFSQAYAKMTAESVVANPFKVGGGPREQLLAMLGLNEHPKVSGKLDALIQDAEHSKNPAVQKLMQTAEGAVAKAVDGQAIKDAVQTIIRSLGLNYESEILRNQPDIGRITESLKPQLIALMQDPSVSAAVRESAELVVMRMNGPLLLSGENGVQHQLIMQVPLDFFGKRIDATMQWNGRMNEDGKIDPDFARILFYLDLHSLEKTIIDMQVQNRVVTVNVFNANPKLELIGAPMQDRLKEGLETTGYKLSGVFFKKFEEDGSMMSQPVKPVAIDNQGIDFRI